ncbi:hypothetical protein [Candidatus Nanopusillus massiliensis]|uniref:hypothetical protein n=1 Tax=Candidatus Nanopusillus massiliensis TaxID=2897163 RepID=UPI001E4866D5|nr:hypothetical protein [Candidatus Nanopusillus massiliensis]
MYSRLFLLSEDKEKFFFNKIYKNYDEIKELAEKYNVNMIYLKIEGDSNNKDIKNSKALSLFNNIKKWINNIGFKIFNFYFPSMKIIYMAIYYIIQINYQNMK